MTVFSGLVQECNEYQKKQDLTSTQVCQSLAHDAHKAEAFGKDNVSLSSTPVLKRVCVSVQDPLF